MHFSNMNVYGNARTLFKRWRYVIRTPFALPLIRLITRLTIVGLKIVEHIFVESVLGYRPIGLTDLCRMAVHIAISSVYMLTRLFKM